jgi:hypothetical protein
MGVADRHPCGITRVFWRPKPSRLDRLVCRKQVVSARQTTVNLFLIKGEFKGGGNGGVSVQQVNGPEQPASFFVFNPRLWFGQDRSSERCY